MDTKTILSEASDRMQKTIEHLEEELLNIRAGKASPTVLNGVFVDYYGSQTPISGVASVTVPDAKTILIQPWDKNLIRAIEKAIIDSNIGLTPSNNGEQIRLSIPPLTEERRKELVKQVRQEAETARISLRNARRDAVEAFKKAQKEGMSEDDVGLFPLPFRDDFSHKGLSAYCPIECPTSHPSSRPVRRFTMGKPVYFAFAKHFIVIPALYEVATLPARMPIQNAEKPVH